MRYKFSNVEVNGVRLNVLDEGAKEAPVIIFLHGFPEFWYGWSHQIDFFKNKGYRILIPDQRGYNLSSKPKAVKDYSTDILVKDIVELIKTTNSRSVYLVGHDWGAAVAWRLAIEYPELIKKLVIINVPHPEVMARNLASNFKQMWKSWYIAFFQIPLRPESILRRSDFRVLEKMLMQSSLPGTFSNQDMSEYKKAWSQQGAIKSMINWYRAAARFKVRIKKESQQLKLPVMIIWGEKDLALVKEMAKESLKYCENGSLYLDPDATHWIHHEKKDLVNQKIAAFIEG